MNCLVYLFLSVLIVLGQNVFAQDKSGFSEHNESEQKLPTTESLEATKTVREKIQAHLQMYEYDKALPLLEQRLEIVKKSHNNQPHREVAEILDNIADCKYRYFWPNEAVAYQQKAHQMWLKLFPEENCVDVARSYTRMAIYLAATGAIPESRQHQQKANDIWVKYATDTNPDMIRNSTLKAIYFNSEGYPDKAIQQINMALDLWQKTYPNKKYPDMTKCYIQLAQSYEAMQHPEQAQTQFDNAIKLLLEIFSDRDCPDIAWCKSELAGYQQRLGRYQDALTSQNEAVEIWLKLYPDLSHPMVAHNFTLLANCYAQNNENSNAIRYYQKAIDAYNVYHHNQNHPDIARSYTNLAMYYQNTENPAQAEAYQKKAVEMWLHLDPKMSHPEIAWNITVLANCYVALNKSPEAVLHFEKALTANLNMYKNQDHPEIANSYLNLGRYLGMTGHWNEAMPVIKKAVAMWEQLSPNKYFAEIAISKTVLAGCLTMGGKHTEALPVIEEAVKIWDQFLPGQNYIEIIKSKTVLAGCLFGVGRHNEALPEIKDAVAMLDQLFPNKDLAEKAMSKTLFAGCLAGIGEYTEALSVIEDAVKMWDRLLPGQDHLEIARSKAVQAGVLSFAGRYDEALPIIEQANTMWEKLLSDQIRPEIAISYTIKGESLLGCGKAQDALFFITKAKEIYDQIYRNQDHPEVARCNTVLAGCLADLKRFQEALPIASNSNKMWIKLYPGEDRPEVAFSHSVLARCFDYTGNPGKALEYQKKSHDMLLRMSHGKDNLGVAMSYTRLALIYLDALKMPQEALKYQEEALAMLKSLYPDQNHPEIARCYFIKGGCYLSTEPDEAIRYYDKALKIRLRLLPVDHPDIALNYSKISLAYMMKHEYSMASVNQQKALDIYLQLYENQYNQDVVDSYNGVIVCYIMVKRYQDAISRCNDLYNYLKRFKDDDDPEIIKVYEKIALCYSALDQHSEAKKYYEKLDGILHNDRSAIIKNYLDLSKCNLYLCHFDEALKYCDMALTEALNYGNSELMASSYLETAIVYLLSSSPRKAVDYARNALAIYRDISGEKSPDVALCYATLSSCLPAAGKHAEAYSYCMKSYELWQEIFQDTHSISPDLQYFSYRDSYASMSKMKGLYYLMYEKYSEASACLEEFFEWYSGTDQMELIGGVVVQALCFIALEKDEEARKLLDDSQELFRQFRLGDIRSSFYHMLLASCYMSLEQPEEALSLVEKALEISRSRYPTEDNLEIAMEYIMLGAIYGSCSQYPEAYLRFNQATQIYKKHDHNIGMAAGYRGQYACSYLSSNDATETITLLENALSSSWKHIAINFPYCNQSLKEQLLSSESMDFQGQQDLMFNLILKRTSKTDSLSQTARNTIGYQTLLDMKHVLLEAQAKEQQVINAIARLDPDIKEKCQKYIDLRRQYSPLWIQSIDPSQSTQPVSPECLEKLHNEIDSLARDIRDTNPQFFQNAELDRISIADIQKSLRPGQVLLDYVTYRPLDLDKVDSISFSDQLRYAVFILSGDTEIINFIDLENSEKLDYFIEQYLDLLEKQTKPSINGRHLSQDDELTLASISSRIKNIILPKDVIACLDHADRLYIVPAGNLFRFPFEALPGREMNAGPDLNYLIDQYQFDIIYLNTARELVNRITTDTTSDWNSVKPKKACSIVNPDFNAESSSVKRKSENKDMKLFLPEPEVELMEYGEGMIARVPKKWGQLPLTQKLTDSLSSLLKQGFTLDPNCSGVLAVEKAFYDGSHCQIMNIATHGYYCNNKWINPLNRSMLIMAGANNRDPNNYPDDSLLTAYEIVGTDLSDVDFVNLIACQTGQGQLDNYHGVIGLRSAFMMAGARSMSASLWSVDEASTVVQMTDFYNCWLGNDHIDSYNRYRAFRAAQLEARKRNPHPWYWAGFVYIGDPGDWPGRQTQ